MGCTFPFWVKKFANRVFKHKVFADFANTVTMAASQKSFIAAAVFVNAACHGNRSIDTWPTQTEYVVSLYRYIK